MKALKYTNISIAFLIAVMFLMFSSPLKAKASVNWPSVSSGSYCEFTAEKNINVYKDTSFKTRGTCSPAKSYNAAIYKNDICYIYKFTNNYIQVNYPTSSGRKTGYIRRTDFVVNSGIVSPTTLSRSNGKVTTYKFPSNNVYGNTESGDSIYALGEKNGYTAIIYTAKSAKRAFKYGFVKTSDYNRIINAPAAAPQTPSTPTPAKPVDQGGPILTNSEIDNAAKKYSITSGTNAYSALQSINTKYGNELRSHTGNPLIFMFEGVGASASKDVHKNAMCVVVKGGKITFISRNCTTIPDQPFTNYGHPTLMSGIYTFKTVIHSTKSSNYAALKVFLYKTDGKTGVIRYNSSRNTWDVNPNYDGKQMTTTNSSINIHARWSWGINNSVAESMGCQLVGEPAFGSGHNPYEYLSFLKAVGVMNQNTNSFSNQTRPNNYPQGLYIVDRSYGQSYLMNVVGYQQSAMKFLN